MSLHPPPPYLRRQSSSSRSPSLVATPFAYGRRRLAQLLRRACGLLSCSDALAACFSCRYSHAHLPLLLPSSPRRPPEPEAQVGSSSSADSFPPITRTIIPNLETAGRLEKRRRRLQRVIFHGSQAAALFYLLISDFTSLFRRNSRTIFAMKGFPDKYQFAGSIQSKHRQIGNAVPPPVAFAFGRKLKEAVDAKRQ